MNFETQHLGGSIRQIYSCRIFSARFEPRCHLSLGGSGTGSSQTTETATNQQTSVQAGTTAVVTGANNKGIASSTGVITQGNNNNVTITTADPAIVQSALDTNSLIATEALATYDHLVTGQTAGQLQAQADSQASDDALTGASIGSSPAPVVVENNPENSGNSGTALPTASSILLYVSIAAGVATIIYVAYEFSKRKGRV